MVELTTTFILEGVLLCLVAIIGLVGNIICFTTICRQKVQKLFHNLLLLLTTFDMVDVDIFYCWLIDRWNFEIFPLPDLHQNRLPCTLWVCSKWSTSNSTLLTHLVLPLLLPERRFFSSKDIICTDVWILTFEDSYELKVSCYRKFYKGFQYLPHLHHSILDSQKIDWKKRNVKTICNMFATWTAHPVQGRTSRWNL